MCVLSRLYSFLFFVACLVALRHKDINFGQLTFLSRLHAACEVSVLVALF
jgi:hypothetical protein